MWKRNTVIRSLVVRREIKSVSKLVIESKFRFCYFEQAISRLYENSYLSKISRLVKNSTIAKLYYVQMNNEGTHTAEQTPIINGCLIIFTT